MPLMPVVGEGEIPAGSTPAGIFGRKIAWLPSYNFSEAPPSIDCLDPWHIRPSPG
jgi:hypothetical protein